MDEILLIGTLHMLLLCSLDYYIVATLMLIITGKKTDRIVTVLYPAIVCGLISACIYWFSSKWNHYSELYTIINAILFSAYFSKMTGEKIGGALRIFVVATLGLLLLRHMRLLLLGTFFNEQLLDEPDMKSLRAEQFIIYIGMRLFDIVLLNLIYYRLLIDRKSRDMNLKFPREAIWQWGFILILFLSLSQLMLYRIVDNTPLLTAYVTAFLLFGVSLTILLLLIYNNKDKQQRIQFLEEKNHVLVQSIKEREETEKEDKIWRHDVKHRIAVLQRAIKEQMPEMEESLAFVYERMKEQEKKPWCSSSLVNSVLNDKIARAKKEHISVLEDIDYFPCHMNEEDLCVIFSNLMDNAIEAAALAKDPRIDLTIRKQGDDVRIQIRNTFRIAPNEKNGLLITTKEEKRYHGWGIQNVTKLAEKNRIAFGYEYDDTAFYARMII